MHHVTMNGSEVVEIFDDRRVIPPAGSIPVDADPSALAHGVHEDLAVVNGRLIVDAAKVEAKAQAKADREAERLERIATAKANLSAAQSVPQMRDAIATLFAELGL